MSDYTHRFHVDDSLTQQKIVPLDLPHRGAARARVGQLFLQEGLGLLQRRTELLLLLRHTHATTRTQVTHRYGERSPSRQSRRREASVQIRQICVGTEPSRCCSRSRLTFDPLRQRRLLRREAKGVHHCLKLAISDPCMRSYESVASVLAGRQEPSSDRSHGIINCPGRQQLTAGSSADGLLDVHQGNLVSDMFTGILGRATQLCQIILNHLFKQ